MSFALRPLPDWTAHRVVPPDFERPDIDPLIRVEDPDARITLGFGHMSSRAKWISIPERKEFLSIARALAGEDLDTTTRYELWVHEASDTCANWVRQVTPAGVLLSSNKWEIAALPFREALAAVRLLSRAFLGRLELQLTRVYTAEVLSGTVPVAASVGEDAVQFYVQGMGAGQGEAFFTTDPHTERRTIDRLHPHHGTPPLIRSGTMLDALEGALREAMAKEVRFFGGDPAQVRLFVDPDDRWWCEDPDRAEMLRRGGYPCNPILPQQRAEVIAYLTSLHLSVELVTRPGGMP